MSSTTPGCGMSPTNQRFVCFLPGGAELLPNAVDGAVAARFPHFGEGFGLNYGVGW